MDAWILTQLFDSILMTSEISMKNEMKSVVKSVSREYHVTLPVPLNHFRVSTDIPDEIAMEAANKKNEMGAKMIKKLKAKEKSDDYNDDNNSNSNSSSKNNDDTVIMQKSLPLKAMVFKEINMPKKWNVPNIYKWTDDEL